MVASGDSETGPEVVDDSPCSGLPLQRGPEGGDAASERYADDEDDLEKLLVTVGPVDCEETYIKPVDVLVPV